MMRWAGMAMAYSSPGNGGAATSPARGGAGLASAIRIDYESVVLLRAVDRNPKGAVGGAAGSPRRVGALERRRRVRVIGRGCDRLLRIVTTAAMGTQSPPGHDPRGNPPGRSSGDPAGGGVGTGGGV